MNSAFYSVEELANLGFRAVGKDVWISLKASLYSLKDIIIGSHVRVDDFCILSGKITIGNFVHIAPYASLCGGRKGIVLEDFVNISRKVEIFAVSDDFSGASMTNPMVPDEYKRVLEAAVVVKQHVVIGVASVILPGVTLEEGSANLVNADMNEEGANMLMLQTRQALGTSSLSMASQAAQSVLRLF